MNVHTMHTHSHTHTDMPVEAVNVAQSALVKISNNMGLPWWRSG